MSAKRCNAAMAGCMLLVLVSLAAGQTTWYVDDDNCPGPGTGTQGDPFCSIQHGIDESADGDEVIVAPGSYKETINFNGKAIELRSSNGADVTIIDATGLHDTVVRCISGEGPETKLDGFTVTGGLGLAVGGGMFIQDSSPTVNNCVFRDNTVFPFAGANCAGAGMAVGNGSPRIINCQFINNVLPDGGQCGGSGAGMIIAASSPTVIGCTFYANSAFMSGGGMENWFDSNPVVTNCTFVANEARKWVGGGMNNAPNASPIVTNCVFWSNTDNYGTGAAAQISGPAVVNYSLVAGGWSGAGGVANISADPRFVDETAGDLRLVIKSPCIDAADNTAVPQDITTDLAGNPRFVDTLFTPDTGNGTPPIVDMGAYEFQGIPEHIPAHSGWGLVVMALALLSAGTVLLRRRRQQIFQRSLGAFVALLAWTSVASAQVDVDPQQIRIDTGDCAAANEISIASSNFNPNEIVAAWNDYRETPPPNQCNPTLAEEVGRIGVGVSMDGGATWTDSLLRPPLDYQTRWEQDPFTAYDDRTGTLWVGGIAFADFTGDISTLFVARKDPGDSTFQLPPVVVHSTTLVIDKAWMAAGPSPTDPNATNLYIAYNWGVRASTDMGETWGPRTWLGNGIGFLPRVGPNGELYVSYQGIGDINDPCVVPLRRSFDAGQTFVPPWPEPPITIAERMDHTLGFRLPGKFRHFPFSYIAVDSTVGMLYSGTVYCVYSDTTNIVGECHPTSTCNGNCNVDLYFTKSIDQGLNWTIPVVINGDGDPPGDQFFPWIEVDRYGNLHMVFLDSRHTMQDDGDLHGWLDAYYSFSDDGGDTWQEFRLTPASFDSFNDALNWPREAQFLGDYIGLGRGGSQVYPCYLSTQNGDPDIYMHVVSLVGACCLGDGSCQELPEASCADAGGSFSGIGTVCNTQVGACCAELIPGFPRCKQRTECSCEQIGGFFYPFDNCATFHCPTELGPQPGG